MRWISLFVIFLSVLPLAAQTPPVTTGFESKPLIAAPLSPPATVMAAPTGPAEVLIEPTVVMDARWQFDIVLGAPTALRLQHQIGDSRLWWEVGAGGYLIFPTVFAGFRTEGRLLETRNHTIAVRPGVDIYYLGGYDDAYHHRRRYSFNDDLHVADFGAITVDFDLQWRARWSDRFHGLVGFKLGCGGAFGGVTGAVPIAGLLLGGNF